MGVVGLEGSSMWGVGVGSGGGDGWWLHDKNFLLINYAFLYLILKVFTKYDQCSLNYENRIIITQVTSKSTFCYLDACDFCAIGYFRLPITWNEVSADAQKKLGFQNLLLRAAEQNMGWMRAIDNVWCRPKVRLPHKMAILAQSCVFWSVTFYAISQLLIKIETKFFLCCILFLAIFPTVLLL